MGDREQVAERLRELTLRARARDSVYRAALAERNAAVLEAARAGWLDREIAEVTGLTVALTKKLTSSARVPGRRRTGNAVS